MPCPWKRLEPRGLRDRSRLIIDLFYHRGPVVSTSPLALTRHARAVAVFRALVLACFFVPQTPVSAQGTPGNEPATVLPSADDKTGTNPLNIQTTVAVLNEFRSLPDELFSNQSRYRYEHRLSVGGDRDRLDVSEGMATLRLTWLPVPAMWIIAEPRIHMDYERDNTSGQIDAEWGHLLFGGVGTYIRPGVGLGSPRARSFDWELQVGFRVIP